MLRRPSTASCRKLAIAGLSEPTAISACRPSLKGRNSEWGHLYNADVVSMPDTWEYPWYAAWDLAFHCIPFAMIDPSRAPGARSSWSRGRRDGARVTRHRPPPGRDVEFGHERGESATAGQAAFELLRGRTVACCPLATLS